jgi:hypothetical protein
MREHTKDPGELPRRWALQTAVLAVSAIAVFWGFYTLDYFAAPNSAGSGPRGGGPLAQYMNFDAASVGDGVSSLSGVNAAVFGIIITVVSIILQLTASRYAGVVRMFLRDRVNMFVAAYYVVACVVSVWLSASVETNYVPRATLAVTLSMTTGGLIIMAPYFGYVFWFLEPKNIIARIRVEAIDACCAPDRTAGFAAQARTIFALEELTDIANNAIAGRDKLIASSAVDAMKDFTLEYLKAKPQMNDAWFTIGPDIRLNPDFVAMDPESLHELEERRTWVEWMVMRQFLSIYGEALGSMRDINYLLAIDTRYLGEAAAEAKDTQLVELVFRFFNSYLRATLNAKDIRTTYNVLNQYRKFVEALLRLNEHRAALDGVRHMKYYGLVAFEQNLAFVTETVGYDLSTIAVLANELRSPVEQDILTEFLELDRPPFIRGQERALLGVRKAQVKLAVYYIATGQDARARSIANDMLDEPRDRLLAIRRELGAVESKEFWEIIDRGRNFEYLPPEQRACLQKYFDWLNLAVPAAEAPELTEELAPETNVGLGQRDVQASEAGASET